MNTFEIKSWVLGTERQITVTEPATLDGTDFKLQLGEPDPLIVRYDHGHWRSVLPNGVASLSMPRQLEIDSIGFQIAKHWCARLEKQLENFQLSI